MGVSIKGEIKPVGVFEEFFISNRKYSRVTLHNFDYIRKKNIMIGSIVEIGIAGDVIPKLNRVIKHGSKGITITECPSCGEEVVQGARTYFCTNSFCNGRMEVILNKLFSRSQLNIPGLSYKTLNKLFGISDVRELDKLYTVEPKGSKRILKIQKQIDKIRYKDDRLLKIIGTFTGNVTAKKCCGDT